MKDEKGFVTFKLQCINIHLLPITFLSLSLSLSLYIYIYIYIHTYICVCLYVCVLTNTKIFLPLLPLLEKYTNTQRNQI
jgi:hypothetical protein